MEVGTVDGWISLLHFLSFFNFSFSQMAGSGRGMAVILHKYYFRYIVQVFGEYICIFCVPRD